MEFVESYVVVDIETTGLNPAQNEIIEIAAMKVDENGEISSFQTLIHPNQPISSFITNLTGITNDMVKDACDITIALKQFDQFIENYTIIGHNVSFDLRFLRYNYKKYLKKSLVNASLDTLYLSRKYLPNLYNHKLDTVAKYFHLDDSNHHRALADVKMTLDIYHYIKVIKEKQNDR